MKTSYANFEINQSRWCSHFPWYIYYIIYELVGIIGISIEQTEKIKVPTPAFDVGLHVYAMNN